MTAGDGIAGTETSQAPPLRPPAFKSQRPGTKGLKNAELDLSAHYKEIVQTRTERAVLPDAESVPFLTVDAAAATGR